MQLICWQPINIMSLIRLLCLLMDFYDLITVTVKSRLQHSKRTCCGWGHKQPVFHHHILKSLEIFELFICRAFSHPSFCLCLLCSVLMFLLFIILRLTDTGFTFFLWSRAEKPTHNHLLISAQIPAPPAVWMVLTFDISPRS